MKKIVSLLAILVVLSGLLFGCKAKTEDTASGANQPGNGAGAGRQFARADLSGEVQAVKGNEVTIKVIKMPAFNGTRNNNNNQNGNRNNRQNGGNNNGNNGGGNGGNNPNMNRGQGAGRAIEFTGETKTITIPAGVSISSMTRGQNGMETTEIEVKDLKQGNILQIWYSDKEKQTISRINVNTMQQNRTQTQNQ